MYECLKCGAEFGPIEADYGSEVLNRDPYIAQHYVLCPDCGSDQIEEKDYVK